MSRSVEEKVEDYYKALLDQLGVKRYEKTQGINLEINNAFEYKDRVIAETKKVVNG